MKLKLTWQVAETPTGKWKSFQKRGWPTAVYQNGKTAATISSDEPYNGRTIKGTKNPLLLRVAEYYSDPEKIKRHGAFSYRRVLVTTTNLKDAKAAIQKALEEHPELWPANVRIAMNQEEDVRVEETGLPKDQS